MKHFSFSYILLCVLFFNCSSSPTITEEIIEEPILPIKPNILLIIADDISKDVVPNYTEGIVKANMPTLSSLQTTGITFDNTWSYAVCTPTRASIFTGKYGINTGVIKVDDPISTSETSLQQHINNNLNDAYATAIIGKWHLSRTATDPITMGVDYYAGILTGGIGNYYSWPLVENGVSSTSTEYATSKLTNLAINWMAAQSKPWFLWVAYNAPHTPFHLAPEHLHNQGSLPTDDASINANPLPYYISAIEALDSEMGRLLNSMTTEERENTIVIFVGDNGGPNRVIQTPYSRTTAKGSLYQGGINVPMVVSGAGVNRMGVRETALINTTDLYTTIGNIAGVNITDLNNSQSFYGLLTNENSTNRDFVYSEKEDAYTVRNATYKYIKFDDGSEELYHLINDAYEKDNLLETTLSIGAENAKVALIAEADRIRN